MATLTVVQVNNNENCVRRAKQVMILYIQFTPFSLKQEKKFCKLYTPEENLTVDDF
jgi:hypothetical protein